MANNRFRRVEYKRTEGEVMQYNERLKDLRISRNVSQKEIAALLNTTAQYYQKYEKGLHPLPIEHLKTLCLFFGVSADYILGLPKGMSWPR